MTTTTVEITVPEDMRMYVFAGDQKTVLTRNALMLYPYIKNMTISHGRAAEILGIRKTDLIDLYAELGISYLNMDISEVEEDIRTFESIS